MSEIGSNLQMKMDEFETALRKDSRTADNAFEMATNLRACIESSPALIEQMNLAATRNHIKGFALMEQGDPSAGALYDSGTIKIPSRALISTPNRAFNIHDMAFVLGHETQHGFNAAERAAAVATAVKEMGRIARSPSEDSYDGPAAAWQQAARNDEAKASLAGWNAAVSQLRHAGQEVTPEAMYKRYEGRARDFVDRLEDKKGQVIGYQPKSGINFKDDLSVDVNDPSNIAALGSYYYDNPSRQVGHAKSTYANYTGATIISHAIDRERYYRSDRMTIDLARHGMSEEALERNGIHLGRHLDQQPRHRYVDTSHGLVREAHFDHTRDARVSTGQVHQHVPIAPAIRGSGRGGFDDPDHPQHALHAELKRLLPPETSADRMAQITLAAAQGGLKPGQIASVAAGADALFIMGTVPGDRTKIGFDMQPPPMQDTLQQADTYQRQQALQQTQWQEEQRQISERAQQGSALGR